MLFSNCTQLKINKVGITVLPQTYMEFIVRGSNTTTLDTRAELINQTDCIKTFVQSKPRVFWFRPNEALLRGWLDIATPAGNFDSGLWILYTGQNQLNAQGAEILFQIQIDVSFQGLDFLS